MAVSRWGDIVASLQTAIQNGDLKPGDRLPPETELAAQWGVCRMTAHRARSGLHRAGWVTRRRRVGTIVQERAPVTIPPPAQRRVALLIYHANDFPQVNYVSGFRAGLPDACHLLFCDTNNDP